jgi:cytochrome P450
VQVGDTQKITDEAQVDQALHDDRLIPPGHANSLGVGTTAELRNAMARFSSGRHHTSRRADVEAAIAAVDLAALNERTLAVTSEHLAMREDCDVIGDVGFVVPTEALAMALGVPSANLAEIRRDVRSIVACIGRGEPSSKVSDSASTRLLARFESHPGGAVATVSMLYQNHDATASLFAATLLADARNEPRRNALARTVRVATTDVHIGEVSVAAGETVEVSLEGKDHEFGAGLHSCPGVEMAGTIVGAMMSTLQNFAWQVDLAQATFTPDGRASSLPRLLERSQPY